MAQTKWNLNVHVFFLHRGSLNRPINRTEEKLCHGSGATDFLCLQSVQNNWGNRNKGNGRPDCDLIRSHKSPPHTPNHTRLYERLARHPKASPPLLVRKVEKHQLLSPNFAADPHPQLEQCGWGDAATIKATLMRSPSPARRFKWHWAVMHVTCRWTFNWNFNQNDTKCPLQLPHFPPHDSTKYFEISPDSAPTCALIPPAAVRMLLSEPRMWSA